MQNVFVIEPNGPMTMAIMDEIDLQTLQNLVGGYIELVNMPEIDGDMYVNEEGLLMGLEYNAKASDLTGQYIVGTAVIVKEK